MPKKDSFIDKFTRAAETDDGKFVIAAVLGATMLRKRKNRKIAAEAAAKRNEVLRQRNAAHDKADLAYADRLDAFADKMDRLAND